MTTDAAVLHVALELPTTGDDFELLRCVMAMIASGALLVLMHARRRVHP